MAYATCLIRHRKQLLGVRVPATSGQRGQPLRWHLEGPRPEQEIHDVPFVGLEPVQFDRRQRADVQSVDVGRVDELAFPRFVARDRRTDQRRADLFDHLALRTPHTVTNGNMYSLLAILGSGESQWITHARKYAQRSFSTKRGPHFAVRSSTPASLSFSWIEA